MMFKTAFDLNDCKPPVFGGTTNLSPCPILKKALTAKCRRTLSMSYN